MARFASVAVLAVSSLGLLPGVLAVPNVTAVPLQTGDCRAWPGYLPDMDRKADETAYLQFTLDHADDPAVDGLYADSTNYTWPMGRDTPDGFNFTAVTFDLRKSRRFAKIDFRCFDGVLRLGYNPNPLGGAITNISNDLPAIAVNKDKRNGFMVLVNSTIEHQRGAVTGYPVEPYQLIDQATNKTLPGVYLGARNQTTWGINFAESEACGEAPFRYEARLQGLPQDPDVEARATYDPEYYAFLRVDRYN